MAQDRPLTLLDEHQAAAWLSLSVNTLRWWRHTGAGPRFVKLSAKVRYRAEDLDEFVRAGLRTSTSDVGPPPAA